MPDKKEIKLVAEYLLRRHGVSLRSSVEGAFENLVAELAAAFRPESWHLLVNWAQGCGFHFCPNHFYDSPKNRFCSPKCEQDELARRSLIDGAKDRGKL